MSCGNKCDSCDDVECVLREFATGVHKAHEAGGFDHVVKFVANHLVSSELHLKEPPTVARGTTFEVVPDTAEALQKFIMGLILFGDYVDDQCDGRTIEEARRMWFSLRGAIPPECKEVFGIGMRIYAHHQLAHVLEGGPLRMMEDHRVILPFADSYEESDRQYTDFMSSAHHLLTLMTRNAPNRLAVERVSLDDINDVRAKRSQPKDTFPEGTTKRHLH